MADQPFQHQNPDSSLRKASFPLPPNLTKGDIYAAAALLHEGGTVAFPTETVYGLGADAKNPRAVQKIFEIKGRPENHPLIVHLADVSHLDLWAESISRAVLQLAARFWPGPLTLILPRRSDVSRTVTGGQNTVALRVPDHPVAVSLLRAFGGGIAAPSANRFGRVSPTTAQHVRTELGFKVEMILDGGSCRVGVESTIVSLMNGKAVLLRPGSISIEELEDTIHQKIVLASLPSSTVRAPGMLTSHYAPAVPLEIHPERDLRNRALQLTGQGYKIAVLKQGDDGEWFEKRRIRTFLMPKSAREYGQTLYATLHCFDQGGFDRLLAQALPQTWEWLAINDRMNRAAQAPPETGEKNIF